MCRSPQRFYISWLSVHRSLVPDFVVTNPKVQAYNYWIIDYYEFYKERFFTLRCGIILPIE